MNLFICLTPLQMLIADHLIKNGEKKAKVLVLTYNINSKYDYYKNKLSNNEFVLDVDVIHIKNGSIIDRLNTFYSVYKWTIHQKNIVNTYLACIDNIYMQYIISKLGSNIYTYDDGTANIISDSQYFIDKTSSISKAFRLLFGIKYDQLGIKQSTKKHYTIYKGIPNIIENTEFIDVFSTNEQSSKNIDGNEKIVNLFLGQPFNLKDASVKIYNQLTTHIDGLNYYLHPREDILYIRNNIGNGNILQSDLIIEEYVMNLVNKGYYINIYTVSSSAGFNLNSAKNINVFFVFNEYIKNEVKQIYSFIKDNDLKILSVNNNEVNYE